MLFRKSKSNLERHVHDVKQREMRCDVTLNTNFNWDVDVVSASKETLRKLEREIAEQQREADEIVERFEARLKTMVQEIERNEPRWY